MEPLRIPGAILYPRISPDESRVIFYMRSDLWLHDIQQHTTTQLTLDRKGNTSPIWAPDGKHFVYVDSMGEPPAIWWARADGSGQRQLLFRSNERFVPTAFSPDGKRLIYHTETSQTLRDLWILPLDLTDPDHPQAGQPELFLRSRHNEAYAAISPDGKWIAYGGYDTGKIEVYVRPAAGPGGPWLLSNGGGLAPSWTKDKSVLHTDPEGRIIEVPYRVEGESFRPMAPRPWVDAKFPTRRLPSGAPL